MLKRVAFYPSSLSRFDLMHELASDSHSQTARIFRSSTK